MSTENPGGRGRSRWGAVGRWLSTADPWVQAIVAAFSLFNTVLVGSGVAGAFFHDPRGRDAAAYVAGLRQASSTAWVRPDARRTLALPEAGEQVPVVAFEPPGWRERFPAGAGITTPGAVWVTTEPELLAHACSADADKDRSFRQVLGLPPTGPRRVLFRLSVPRGNLHRPCRVTTALDAVRCETPSGPPGAGPPGGFDAAGFVHYHRARLATEAGRSDAAGEFPFDGRIITGYGWTYNLSPHANTPVGVTEFLVAPATGVTAVGDPQTPAEFCRGG